MKLLPISYLFIFITCFWEHRNKCHKAMITRWCSCVPNSVYPEISAGTAVVPGSEHFLGTPPGTTVENKKLKAIDFLSLIDNRTTLRKYIKNTEFL